MFELVKKTISIKNPKILYFFQNIIYLKKIEKNIDTSLSSRWINQKYNEHQFLELISKLEKIVNYF